MAKRVTVLTIDAKDYDKDATKVKDTLRSLRPLGVRFSVEEIDGADITITAWLEEREPRQPKERKALGATISEAEKIMSGADR